MRHQIVIGFPECNFKMILKGDGTDRIVNSDGAGKIVFLDSVLNGVLVNNSNTTFDIPQMR